MIITMIIKRAFSEIICWKCRKSDGGDRDICDRESAILNEYFCDILYGIIYIIVLVDSVGSVNDGVDEYDNK